jgi:hypothetical protein
MKLECFPTVDRPPDLVPGRPQRAWMDAFHDRHAYRCLPLSMANSTGWEILCPFGFSAEWNGGIYANDITFRPDTPHPDSKHFVQSHFSHGVLTLHPGYLFRTPPGWSMWCMGPPNHVKDGIQPLVGLIETDWLPFPFTMNWLFTRPGKVHFAKGEPFCFITLVQDKAMEQFDVVQRPLDSDVDMRGQYDAWHNQRSTFNAKLRKNDPETMKEAWQRFYFRGELPDDTGPAPADHVNKRRLKSKRIG